MSKQHLTSSAAASALAVWQLFMRILRINTILPEAIGISATRQRAELRQGVLENYDLVNAMGQVVGNYKLAQGNNSLNLKNSVVNVGVYYLHNTNNNKSIKLMVQQ